MDRSCGIPMTVVEAGGNLGRRGRGWRAAAASLGVVALSWCGPALAAQDEPAAARQQFAEETTVTVVEVPVQVLRDGEPVAGLTAEDFVVYDEGEPRPVSFFEAVDLHEVAAGPADSAAPGEAEEAVPAAARRRFLLFFDLDFTAAPYLARAQEAALHLVREGLRPTDLVGVAFFNGRQGGSSVIGFTSDRREVVLALEELGRLLGESDEGAAKGERGDGRARDALGLTFGGWNVAAADIGRAAVAERSLADETLDWIPRGGGGGKGRPDATEVIEDMAAYAMEDMRQSRAAKASALMETLRGLARQTRFIEGTKHLLLFSQGFESYLYTEEGQSWLHTEIEGTVEELRRAGWVLHGIETAAVAGGFAPLQKRETLSMLAQSTGGELHARSNDLAGALDAVLERTSVTYLLGFQTREIPMDGSFRRLRVELAAGAGGGRVLHRTGYFTPRASGAGDDDTWAAEAGELLLTADELDEVGTAMAAASLRLTAAGARVPVLVEIAGAGLAAAGAASGAPVRVELHVYAFDSGGAVTATRSRTLLLDPSRLPSPAGGFKVVEELDLPPGEHQVRVLVRTADTGRVALRTADVTVPAEPAQEESPLLLPPLFVQAAGEPWMLVREGPAGEVGGAEADFPFVFQGRRFLPAAAPSIAAGTGRVVLVLGHGLPESVQELQVRVVDLSGAVVEGAELGLVGQEQGLAGAPDVVALQLSAAELEPGYYAVEVAIPGRVPWTRGGRFQVTAAPE